MNNIKIIEGTAESIEAELKEYDTYEMVSFQFTHRSLVYNTNNTISDRKHSFYVAVLEQI